MGIRRSIIAAAGIALLGISSAACRMPSRYDVAVVADGLDHPWDAAFAPGGELLFTERVGDINVRRGGRVTTFNRPPDVVQSGEGGMMGIAVDPAFATNRRIYTCYLSNQSGALDVRVVRWEVSADWRTLAKRRRPRDRHPGDERAALRLPHPLRPRQDAVDHDGRRGGADQPAEPEVARRQGPAHHDRRQGGAGNPGGALLPQIYAYGFRNPQGISFRPADGRPFIIEHGPGCDDEITALRAGGNGGWDPVAPGNPAAYNERVPMTDLRKFPNALRPAWSSGCPTIAPSGGTFVDDPDWGLRNNQMAVAVLKGQQLRMIRIADGQTDAGTAIITNQGRLRVAVDGPDGKLYVLVDANPGRIITVDPVP